MRKQISEMKAYVNETNRKVRTAKKWMLTAMVAGMVNIPAFPVYADGLTVTDSAIKSMLNSTIDIVFLILASVLPLWVHFS